MICVMNFGELLLEMVIDGEDYLTADVKFTLKTKYGRTIQTSSSIPVKSLFDITHIVDLSIRKYKADLEATLKGMKENKDGKKD